MAVFALALASLAVSAVLPSAAATPSRPDADPALVEAGLSSLSKVKIYLRSRGIDPAGMVVQRGARNYAGPNCPGPAWNCTTSTKVVQISARTSGASSFNRFVCKRDRGAGTVTQDKTRPDQSCIIVQPGGARNSATCDIRTTGTTGSLSQACFITQGGESNEASAQLVAAMGAKQGEQEVRQRIEILQTNGSSGNRVEASQIALLGVADKGAGNVAATQDFHQVVCVNQQAAGGGSNAAKVNQHGAAAAYYENVDGVDIDQNQGFVPSECTINPPGAGPFADISGSAHDPLDCPVAGGSGFPKEAANSCARVQQVSETGTNAIDDQNQSNTLVAAVKGASDVDIEQGRFSGGIESTPDQLSDGVSSIVDTQDADQVADVRDATGFVRIDQVEDPRCCAGGHQLGNGANTWSLEQDLVQRAFVDGVLVDPGTFDGFILQVGADYGNCVSSGNCTVEQSVSNNVQTQTNSCSDSSCDIFISCVAEGGDEGGGEITVQLFAVCATEDEGGGID